MSHPHTVAHGLGYGSGHRAPIGGGGMQRQHVLGPGAYTPTHPAHRPGWNGGGYQWKPRTGHRGTGPWWTWPRSEWPPYYQQYNWSSIPAASQIVLGDGTPQCHTTGPSGIACAARGDFCKKTGPLRVNAYGHVYDGACVNPHLL